nr:uncharacterized protein LOC117982141 [Maniola hyperantus]
MVAMSGLLITVLITFHENVKADTTIGSRNKFLSLKPSNVSIDKMVNTTKTTVHVNAKRKAVLILHSDPALRSEDKKVTSLYYEDYDEKGNVLNTMWMYNLQDVAEFFRIFLDTEICYGRCDK